MIGAFLEWLARHATKLLAGAVFLGLAVPPLAELLRPGLTTFVVVNLVVALLRLDLGEVRSYFNRPYLIGANIVFLLLICPVAASLIMQPFGLPPALHAAVVLMAAAPPIMSAAAFALLLGLDAALAIFVVVATHAIVPFTLPVMALWLLGMELDIGVAELMLRLGLVIGISVHDTTLGTTVANLGMTDVTFPKPLFHGDTVRVQTRVISKRESKSRPTQGIVTLDHVAFNQHGDEVARCRRQALMLKRPAGAS